MSDNRSARIAALNDQFRASPTARGRVVVTAGVAAKGEAFVNAALHAVAAFTAFDADNDPWGERDFGRIEIDGT